MANYGFGLLLQMAQLLMRDPRVCACELQALHRGGNALDSRPSFQLDR